MRHHAFDQFVKALAAEGSRRWALKAVVAGALGSTLTMRQTRSGLALPAEELECRQECTLKCRRQGNRNPRCVALCLEKLFPGSPSWPLHAPSPPARCARQPKMAIREVWTSQTAAHRGRVSHRDLIPFADTGHVSAPGSP